MSFDIKLQINASEKNALTKDITDVLTVSGTLKSETSVIDPVILINCELSSVVNVNYMTIATFGRSYFVDNIRSIRNGLVEFSGHVDVLSTYQNAIRAKSAIIKRQENDWNLYLDGGSFRVYQNQLIQTLNLPNGFTANELVLAVAGSGGAAPTT